MKKKLFQIIFPSVLLLLILFFPLPAGAMNDGGSRDFRALTYRVIRWNRICADPDSATGYSLYQQWRFYPIPLCYESVDALWQREAETVPSLKESVGYKGFFATVTEISEVGILVKGLDSNPLNYRYEFFLAVSRSTKYFKGDAPVSLSQLAVGDTVCVEFSGEIMESYPAQISQIERITVTQPSEDLSYEVSYAQVDGNGENASLFSRFSENTDECDGWNRLPVISVESKEELQEILTDAAVLEHVWNESAFYEFGNTYDEEFFREKTLLLIYVAESSGSNRHEIHRCYAADGVCTVVVKTLSPEVVTFDMAGWIVALSVDKDAVNGLSFEAYRLRK